MGEPRVNRPAWRSTPSWRRAKPSRRPMARASPVQSRAERRVGLAANRTHTGMRTGDGRVRPRSRSPTTTRGGGQARRGTQGEGRLGTREEVRAEQTGIPRRGRAEGPGKCRGLVARQERGPAWRRWCRTSAFSPRSPPAANNQEVPRCFRHLVPWPSSPRSADDDEPLTPDQEYRFSASDRFCGIPRSGGLSGGRPGTCPVQPAGRRTPRQVRQAERGRRPDIPIRRAHHLHAR